MSEITKLMNAPLTKLTADDVDEFFAVATDSTTDYMIMHQFIWKEYFYSLDELISYKKKFESAMQKTISAEQYISPVDKHYLLSRLKNLS
jgi:hypothetical protein